MPKSQQLFVNVAAWVDAGEYDAVEYRIRQATHVILAAIARISSPYTMYLKGGLLLDLVYNSPRRTKDIDFTAGFGPQEDIVQKLEGSLNNVFPSVIAELGYVGDKAEVKRIKVNPKKEMNPLTEASFPSLNITIIYISVMFGRKKEDTVDLDLSFNEVSPRHIDILDIGKGVELFAYSLSEIIAEKYRALLQQVIRRRRRRQDIYDIDFLLKSNECDADLMASIHTTLVEKCRSRDINPDITSFDNPEIKDRAGHEWSSIELETGALPEFDLCFENVREFYRKLPWE